MLRIEPESCSPCLRLTDFRPWRNTAGPAAPGGDDDSGPFPCPGDHGPRFLGGYVNGASLTNRPPCRSLRFAPLSAAPARSSE